MPLHAQSALLQRGRVVGQHGIGQRTQLATLAPLGAGQAFQLGQGEQPVDQLAQPLGLLTDLGGETGPLGLGQRRVFEQLGRAADRGQRAFQLMRQRAHELLTLRAAVEPLAHRAHRLGQLA